jgi:myo-inositol 2-dehydrogenase/D-chiro-inositol 1-dehydrogenase
MLRAGNVHETTVELAGKHGFTGDPVQHFFLERYAEAYRRELASFIAAVGAGKTPAPTGTDGLRAQMLADAATESRRSGGPVPIAA